jgi:hypothetical protein
MVPVPQHSLCAPPRIQCHPSCHSALVRRLFHVPLPFLCRCVPGLSMSIGLTGSSVEFAAALSKSVRLDSDVATPLSPFSLFPRGVHVSSPFSRPYSAAHRQFHTRPELLATGPGATHVTSMYAARGKADHRAPCTSSMQSRWRCRSTLLSLGGALRRRGRFGQSGMIDARTRSRHMHMRLTRANPPSPKHSQ